MQRFIDYHVYVMYLFICVCMCIDRAGEPAVISGGVPGAVPQTGCAGSGGAF